MDLEIDVLEDRQYWDASYDVDMPGELSDDAAFDVSASALVQAARVEHDGPQGTDLVDSNAAAHGLVASVRIHGSDRDCLSARGIQCMHIINVSIW